MFFPGLMSARRTGLELPAAILGPCPHSRQTAFPASNRLLIKQKAVPLLRPLTTVLRMGPSPEELPPPKQQPCSLSGTPTLGLLAQEKGPSPRNLLSECLQADTPDPAAACFCRVLTTLEHAALLILGVHFGFYEGSDLDSQTGWV